MSSEPDSAGGRTRIDAASYQPYEAEESTRSISPLRVALISLALVAAGILFFLFTAKSVTLKFSAPPSAVDISGGLSFDLGGVYLLRTGEYQVKAEATGYHPLQQSFVVGDERQQDVALNFQPLPGVIDFDLQPADAAVTLDGQPLSTDQIARIPAGEHEVTIAHPRYQAQTIIFDVAGREEEQTLQVSLRPNWGDISLTSQPAGAEVRVDGEPSGFVTPATVPVLAGEREISLHKEGFKAGRLRLVVAAEQPEQLPEFKLVQADATLLVTTRPSGAGITVDGSYVGQAPIDLTLKSGRAVRVEAILKGHRRTARQVNLSRGENPPIQLSLTRELGEVSVQARPAGAQLRINGRDMGEANQTLKLPTDTQRIEIELPGYAAYRTELTPRAGLTQSVKVQLLTLAEARRRALKPRYETGQGQELVLIEPGTLTMGASRREPGRRANETLQEVTLSRLYYVSRKEITNAQFRAFATAHDSGAFEDNTLNKDDQPVVNVSWHDAALYCNWLSKQEGLQPYYAEEFGKATGVINPRATGYRLLTEAEWSWLAFEQLEDGRTVRYPWGSNLPPPDRHGNYADRAAQHLVGRILFNYNDNYVTTAPVGSFKPNRYDIYDLGGNVAEWTHDFYAIPDKEPKTDPMGPNEGEYRVIKGSSWMHGTVTDLRLSFRDYGIDGRPDLGFRIARFAE